MNSRNSAKKQVTPAKYDHAAWEARRRLCRFLLRTIAIPLLVKMERVEGLENIPAQGAAILFINHIAFVDPVVCLHVAPRNIVPLAKIEVYNYPIVGIFPRLWGVIPVRRGEVDRRAVQSVLAVLEAGEIALIAPEGTRHPRLERGKEGVAYLAARSGAPIVPTAVTGTPGFPALRGSARWQQPGASIHFGRPFRYSPDLKRPRGEQLRQMTDEAMYILAAMLPVELRGIYADFSQATQETIQWL